MSKEAIRVIRPHVVLYRCTKTGLAFIDNGEAGCRQTVHPNTGGEMWHARKLYGEKAKLLKRGGFIYNTSSLVVSDDLDEIVRQHCRCGGNHDL